MSTINEATAKKIMEQGLYVDETRYIVTYDNMFGGKSWGTIGWRENPARYHESPACHEVKEIWRHPKEKFSLMDTIQANAHHKGAR